MLKSVRLINFFSFRDETILLSPDNTLFAGINGAGKSNFLRALHLLKTGTSPAAQSSLQTLILSRWGGFDRIYCNGVSPSPTPNTISLEFVFDPAALLSYGFDFRYELTYSVVLARKGASDSYYISERISDAQNFVFLEFSNGEGVISERNKDGESSQRRITEGFAPDELALARISEFDADRYYPLVALKRAIQDIVLYTPFDTGDESKLRHSGSLGSQDKKLLPDGSNLFSVLAYMKLKHRSWYRKFAEKLTDVNPHYIGVESNALGDSQAELYLDEGMERAVPAIHVSDGTLRFLCLLAIVFNPDRGKLVCIDEPEAGLHPDMMYNLAQAIRDASADTQFILVTHSPDLMNGFSLDRVRVFEKSESNETEVFAYEDSDFQDWYEHFAPGRMWQAGVIGGKRWG